MKITVQDSDFINWDKVGEKVREEILAKASSEILKAAEYIKSLKPGKRKTFHIKVGSITISRPKD